MVRKANPAPRYPPPSNCTVTGPPGIEETSEAARAYLRARLDMEVASRNLGYLLSRATLTHYGPEANKYVDGLVAELAGKNDEPLLVVDRWQLREIIARAFAGGRASMMGH